VGRQTATSGINPAGSSRAERLDPPSLPMSFAAHDVRADDNIRQVEIHRERIVVRRAVRGMRMNINVRVNDFLGVALRDVGESQMLVLRHRDPSLSVTLCVSEDAEEIAEAWTMWSELFSLPQLTDEMREPASRRRRRNAIRARRPKFLMRRRIGALLNPANMFRGEREIIARN
jgi:Family of unknown function (DUF6101)